MGASYTSRLKLGFKVARCTGGAFQSTNVSAASRVPIRTRRIKLETCIIVASYMHRDGKKANGIIHKVHPTEVYLGHLLLFPQVEVVSCAA